VDANISEENAASFFRVKVRPESGGSVLLQSVYVYVPDYAVPQTEEHV
jgi:hypothetical protein